MSFPTPDQCIDLIEAKLRKLILEIFENPSIMKDDACVYIESNWIKNKNLYVRLTGIMDELRSAGWVVHLKPSHLYFGRQGLTKLKDLNDFEPTPSVPEQEESNKDVPGYLRDIVTIEGKTYHVAPGYSITEIRAALISEHPNLEKMNCLFTQNKDGSRTFNFTSST